MMNLCSDGHDEVCYEGTRCPACHELRKRDAILKSLRDEIDEMRKELSRSTRVW